MPATWRDISLKLDIAGTPFDRHSIDAGAFYMAKLSARWTSERPEFERHRLAQASYNSGFGNVVKSQRLCNGAPYWDEIKVCQPQVTGRHAAETIGYVTKIEEHARNMAKGLPWLMPKGLRDEFTAREIARIAKRYDIRRYFNGLAWGTYWRLWGGWITADHVHKEMHGTRPPFIDKNAVLSRDEGVIDATGYGLEFPDTPPRAPKTGETIYLLGYPAGSLTPTLRLARIHAVRSRSAGFNYTHPDTVSSIDAPTVDIDDIRFEPVTGGMSGGLAVTLDGKTPLGVLVTQNSPAELSGDDKPDHSADIVPLRDFWEAMK